jgi:hypothetical protein
VLKVLHFARVRYAHVVLGHLCLVWRGLLHLHLILLHLSLSLFICCFTRNKEILNSVKPSCFIFCFRNPVFNQSLLTVVFWSGMIAEIAFEKLLLQEFWTLSVFLDFLIQAPRNLFGKLSSLDLVILPTYLAVLQMMKALMLGMLQNLNLTFLFLILSSSS